MVRARRILEVIEADGLIDRAAELGEHLLDGLRALAAEHPVVTEVRGRGLMCAFTLPTAQLRDEVIRRLREDERVLVLGSRRRPASGSVRRSPCQSDELDRGLAAIDRVLSALLT